MCVVPNIREYLVGIDQIRKRDFAGEGLPRFGKSPRSRD
jgi:hypothetical protein